MGKENKSKSIFYDWIEGIEDDARKALSATNPPVPRPSDVREYLYSILGRCDSILKTLDFADDNKKGDKW